MIDYVSVKNTLKAAASLNHISLELCIDKGFQNGCLPRMTWFGFDLLTKSDEGSERAGTVCHSSARASKSK
jgi:hypothetical protein